MLPRTAIILLPLLVLLAPLPLSLLLRRLGRLAFPVALLVTLVAARLALPFAADRIRAAPRGDLADADSFVVFAFGLGPPIAGMPSAGESNRALARWLLDANPNRKPTVVQDGVYRALLELHPAAELASWVTPLPSPPGVYIDTYGGALQTEVVLQLKGLDRPVLAAHDLQLQRMVWTFEQGGRRDFVVPDMPRIPFDPQSSQHAGTRSEVRWLWRELLAARPVTLRMRNSCVLLALIALAYLAAAWRATRPNRPPSPA